ncbi:MAG: hypothetical protein WBE72_07810 [Terracidiphilus sp.]
MTRSPSTVFTESPDAMARRLMQKAHNRDGLPEIAVGLILLAVSGLIYTQSILPRGSVAFKAAVLAIAILIPVLCFASPPAVRRLRSRYLIGRVGYVRPKPIALKPILSGILLALGMFAVLFGVVPRLAHPNFWLLAGSGLLAGAIAAWGGRSLRFAVGGIAAAAAGLLLALSSVSLQTGFSLLWGFVGILSLVSGCVALARLLRSPFESGE